MKKNRLEVEKKCKIGASNNKYFFNEYNDDDTLYSFFWYCLLSCINYLQKLKINYVIERNFFNLTIY